jgi:hypothetical protein
MKKYILPLLCLCFVWSCEDVVDIETPTTEPILIVNGLVRVNTQENVLPIKIKLTESANFFGEIVPAEVTQAIIYYGTADPNNSEAILNAQSCILKEEPDGSGIFIPDTNQGTSQEIPLASVGPETRFMLTLNYKGENYKAVTPYVPAVPIDTLTQGTETIFDPEDTEVIISYTDAPNREDYYIFDLGYQNYLTTEDTFYQGQEFQFSYFYDKDLSPNETLTIKLLGADRTFYNYMTQIIEKGTANSSPFSTPESTIRGNVYASNNNEIFALGYFAVVEEYQAEITIE